MSKSKGNVIDPLTLTDKFGTDAFRMGVIVGILPELPSLFLKINKSLQAFRQQTLEYNSFRSIKYRIFFHWKHKRNKIRRKDKEILEEINNAIKDITNDMDNYRFYLAGEKLITMCGILLQTKF